MRNDLFCYFSASQCIISHEYFGEAVSEDLVWAGGKSLYGIFFAEEYQFQIATMAKKTVTAAPKTVNSIFLELPMMNRSVSVKIRKPSVKAVK